MTGHLAASVAALVTLAGIGVARAEQPLFLPLRDVNVTYRLVSGEAASAPREAHLYFSAAGQLMRLDEPGRPGYAVINRASQTVLVVLPGRKQYGTIPFDPEMAAGFILNDQMQFSRIGSDTVAGLRCNTWSVHSQRAVGAVCITDDGVMLRGNGQSTTGGISGLEAISVNYGPQPPSLFVPPPDYKPIASAPPR